MKQACTVGPLAFPAVPDKSFHISVPGSKSYSNRALIAAALAQGASTLTGFSSSKDSEALLQGFSVLGIDWSQSGDTITIHSDQQAKGAHGTIDVGPAGTTMRFLTALCASRPATDIILCGSERMHQRPIGVLVDALRQLGADITYLAEQGFPPLRIRGRDLSSAHLSIPGDISSQFLTALLLIAPVVEGGIDLVITGELVSRSYLEMTQSTLQAFGVNADVSARRCVVEAGQRYQPRHYHIEGDASGASYFWGIGAITGSPVRVYNVRFDSAQGDCQFPYLLQEMGCSITSGEDEGGPWIEVYGRSPLRGISCDMTMMPDVAQTLAVIACFAEGATVMKGLSTLRVKETDRIAALYEELKKVGIHSKPTHDSLTVFGGHPHAGRIATYEDHRMAMAFSLLGSRIAGVQIEDPEVVQKSFPSFWSTLQKLPISVTFER
jgi:3-phosphoshikimate 1-carboxyvinyltransferase